MVEAIITIMVMVDAPKDITVTGGAVVILVTVTSDIMKNTLQKIIYYNNVLCYR